jgi:hypothetical protein
MEDVFKYRSVTEWNGYVIEFGMPSSDGNLRLTEMCLGADSCLEATKDAISLSWINIEFQPARSSEVLEIIRTLFGGDGKDIITYPLIVDGVYFITCPPTEFAIEFFGEDWEVSIVHADAFDLALRLMTKDISVEVGTDEWYQLFVGSGIFLQDITKTAIIEKHAHNPRWVPYTAATETEPGIYTDSGYDHYSEGWWDPTHWDNDGAPWLEVQWKDIQHQQECSADFGLYSMLDLAVCEEQVRSGFCRQVDFQEPLVISNKHTARCSNNDLKTKILCEESEYTWTPIAIPYSNKEEIFPASDNAFILQPLKESSCNGINLDPEWGTYNVETLGYNSNSYEYVFVDIETPLGFVPGTAVITMVRFRGDFEWYKEFIDVSIGMSVSWENIGQYAESKSSGVWQDATEGVFSPFVVSGYGSQQSELGTYQGKVGFFTGIQPSPEVNNTTTYCRDAITGEPFPAGNYKNWYESYCIEDNTYGPLGIWDPALPWWQIQFEIRAEVDAGLIDNWTNGGKCLFTSDQWPGGAGIDWKQAGVFSTRTSCMETSQTMPQWDSYYLMWIEETNYWTKLYHNWVGSAGSSTYYYGAPENARYWFPPGGGTWSSGREPYCYPSGAGTCSNSNYNYDATNWGGALNETYYWRDLCKQYNHFWYDAEDEVTCLALGQGLSTADGGTSWTDYGNYWGGGKDTVWENLADGNMAVDGSIHHHRGYNLLTSKSHRIHPKKHIDIPLETRPPYSAPTSFRMNHRDINFSWGNGIEVGRATIPTWITSSFNWPDADRIYDYCHMRGWNAALTDYTDYGEAPQPQWSLPLYDDIALGNPYQGWGCNTSGTCVTVPGITGQNYVPVPQFENDSNGCYGEYRCNNQDQYSYYGLTSVECTDGGYNRRDWNPTTEVFDNTFPPSPHYCYGSGPAIRADGSVGTVYAYYSCAYGGRCLDSSNNLMGHDCTNGNRGNQNGYYTTGFGASGSGDAWYRTKCQAGKWANKGSCLNSGTCVRMWNLSCNYNNCGWRHQSGSGNSNAYSNAGSNDYDWCMSLAAQNTVWCNNSSWCVGEYTTWTSDNYHWEGGDNANGFSNSLHTSTWLSWQSGPSWPANAWGRKNKFRSGDGTSDNQYFQWQKTYPKTVTHMPISEHISDPELQHLNQTYPAHTFVNDSTSWDGSSFEGWCSETGERSGNEIPLAAYEDWNPPGNPSWGHSYGCDDAGTCSDPAHSTSTGQGSLYQHWYDCEEAGTCYPSSGWNNSESGCLHNGECTLNGVVIPWAENERFDCWGMGTCSDSLYSIPGPHANSPGHSMIDRGEYYCENAGETWTDTPGIFIHDNTWTGAGNTWTRNGWGWMAPLHHFASEPTESFGYHTTDRPDGALIRWKAPESFMEIGERLYTRPTHFRIYRSPWVSPEGLSFTGSDYEERMWTFAGEVMCDSDYDFQYFTDTKGDLIEAGVGPFDRVYYRITAVWKDWNWRAGYDARTFGGYGTDGNWLTMQNWDYRFYQLWSNFAQPGSEDEFGATERLDGACLDNGQSYPNLPTYETACLGSGTCTWSQFTDEATCAGQGTCSWSELNNNESECLAHGVCSDPTFNFYIGTGGFQNFANEAACLAYSGTCTNQSIGSCSLNWHNDNAACVASGSIWTSIIYPQFDNEVDCIAEINGKCNEPLFNSDESACLSETGTCTGDPAFDNNPTGCLGGGECDPNYYFDNDEAGCLAANGGQGGSTPNAWIPGGNTFTTTGIWTFNTWTPVTNSWTPAGLTWLKTGDTCSDPTYNWNVSGCIAAGTCTDSNFDNDEAGCLASSTCSDTHYGNEVDCLEVPGTCMDASGSHVRAWGGAPITQDWICASAGTCNGSQSWWPQSCLDVGTCANIGTGIAVPQFDDDPYSCHHANGTCSDASITSGGSCIASGTCSDPADGTAYPQWDNDRYACAGAFGGDFSEPFWHRGWSWWNPTNTWTPDNEFTSTQTWITTGIWTNSCSVPAFGSAMSGTIIDGDLPGCLAAGTCSDSQWNNDEVNCLDNSSCSDLVGTFLSYSTEGLCLAGGLCSDTNWTIEVDCNAAGTCSDSQWNNDEVNCLDNSSCSPDSSHLTESNCLVQGTCTDTNFNNNETGCLGAGTCIGDSMFNDYEAACIAPWRGTCSDPQYFDDQMCLGVGTCSDPAFAGWRDGCLYLTGTCSDSAYNNNGFSCLHNYGTCSDPAYNNNYWDCIWAYETFTHANTWTGTNTWTSTNTWTLHTFVNANETWTSANTWNVNTWTSANNTWTATTVNDNTWNVNTWVDAIWNGNNWLFEYFTSAGNTWNGPIWTSDNYTWSTGSWAGTPHPNYAYYGKTLFHLIEENGVFASPNEMIVGRSLVNAATLWHPEAGDEWSDLDDGSNTVRYTGYFKAPTSGEYQFKVSSYDASYLWLGENGWSIDDLVAWREHDNYLAGCPGDHGRHDAEASWNPPVPGYQFHIGRISLVKDEVYPLLAYFTSYHQIPGTPIPTWRPKWDIRVHYPDGDWNNGGNGSGVWGTGTFSLMPGYLSPTGSGSGFRPSHGSGNTPGTAFVQPSMNGQTVEGIHTNEDDLAYDSWNYREANLLVDGEYEGDIYSFYTE